MNYKSIFDELYINERVWSLPKNPYMKSYSEPINPTVAALIRDLGLSEREAIDMVKKLGGSVEAPPPPPPLVAKYKVGDFLAIFDNRLNTEQKKNKKNWHYIKITEVDKDEVLRRVTYNGFKYIPKEAMPDDEERYSYNGRKAAGMDLENRFSVKETTEQEFREVTARHPLTSIFV